MTLLTTVDCIKKCRVVTGIILMVILVMTSACDQRRQGNGGNRLVGVKIYDFEGDLSALYNEWKQLGVNTVFASTSLLSDSAFVSLAGRNHIKTFVILPIFYNPEALAQDTSLYAITNRGERAIDEWVTFVCPSRMDYRRQQLEFINSFIQENNPDGLSIDFIRHFVFWEKVYPDRTPESIVSTCFDPHCLGVFQEETGISIPQPVTTAVEAATWIEEYHLEEWTEWRCRQITGIIAQIAREARARKPDILINVHAVPWREDDFGGAQKSVAGQDLARIVSHVDLISPMTYFHMVKRPPAWVHDVVQDVYRQSGGNVIPSIQVERAYLEEPLSVEAFRHALDEALKPPSQGVVFWSWEALDRSPAKKEVVRSVTGSLQ